MEKIASLMTLLLFPLLHLISSPLQIREKEEIGIPVDPDHLSCFHPRPDEKHTTEGPQTLS